jgi:hypothetical protein
MRIIRYILWLTVTIIWAVLLAALWCQLNYTQRELLFYRSYAQVETGMLDREAEQIIGRNAQIADKEQLPKTLGGLPEYRNGCPASFILKSSSGEFEKFTYSADTAIVWLVWYFGDNDWIAIACLGDKYTRNTSAMPIVAKKYHYNH